jgi:hypothetical protein
MHTYHVHCRSRTMAALGPNLHLAEGCEACIAPTLCWDTLGHILDDLNLDPPDALAFKVFRLLP